MNTYSHLENLHAEFWRSPDDALLTRACVAAGLRHSSRWLSQQEKAGRAPKRQRIGRFVVYRKRDVLAHWVNEFWSCKEQSIPAVYLAGKIGKNDWCHGLVPGLRGHAWKDGPIVMEGWQYVGPFFVSCDHGCNHVPNGHGAAGGYMVGESAYTRQDVIRNNNASLDAANLVFAYITKTDCYGTLIEIGWALRAGKRVVLAFAPDIPHQDFWYAVGQVNKVYVGVNEVDLPALLSKEVEAMK